MIKIKKYFFVNNCQVSCFMKNNLIYYLSNWEIWFNSINKKSDKNQKKLLTKQRDFVILENVVWKKEKVYFIHKMMFILNNKWVEKKSKKIKKNVDKKSIVCYIRKRCLKKEKSLLRSKKYRSN